MATLARRAQPVLGPASLATVSVAMAPAVAGVDAWGARTGQWLDLEHELGTASMDALMRSMFSTAFDPTPRCTATCSRPATSAATRSVVP